MHPRRWARLRRAGIAEQAALAGGTKAGRHERQDRTKRPGDTSHTQTGHAGPSGPPPASRYPNRPPNPAGPAPASRRRPPGMPDDAGHRTLPSMQAERRILWVDDEVELLEPHLFFL